MPKTAIQASGLVKWFGEGEAKTTALREVSLEAQFGEMVYIVGPSGSGKTTLLSVLTGILKPNAGKVLLEGTDIWGLDSDQLADFRLGKIGFVFQDYHLFPRLTTAENAAIPLILKRKPWDEAVQRGGEVPRRRGTEEPRRIASREVERRRAAARGHCPGHRQSAGYLDYG